MKVWLARVELEVEAETRQEAWEKARHLVAEQDGVVVSIPHTARIVKG